MQGPLFDFRELFWLSGGKEREQDLNIGNTGEDFMRELLYALVGLIAKIHNYLLKINDAFEYQFSDKQLHFLVIGFLGMGMIFVIYPLFKWLAGKGHILTIAWIYVFTLIIVITFAIEIGQKITKTGSMEFADIMYGVLGFIVMFCLYAGIREIVHLVKKTMAQREK